MDSVNFVSDFWLDGSRMCAVMFGMVVVFRVWEIPFVFCGYSSSVEILLQGLVFCKNWVFLVLLASRGWPMKVWGCADWSLDLDVLQIVGCLGLVWWCVGEWECIHVHLVSAGDVLWIGHFRWFSYDGWQWWAMKARGVFGLFWQKVMVDHKRLLIGHCWWPLRGNLEIS